MKTENNALYKNILEGYKELKILFTVGYGKSVGYR
jgi:hypothetical protein